ncbi:MAG TPA: sensor domain-containing diguanylate cyclase [Candidatus Eisenbacteria bacterium]|nr:sensor domain-containing diguanylate cyclase [Candidatus Eisenbacteria bacterium]
MDLPRYSEEVLHAFLSDPREAVVGYLLDGTVFLWNRAAEMLYGYTAEEMLANSARPLFPIYELQNLEAVLNDPSRFADGSLITSERLQKGGLKLSVCVTRSLLRNPQSQPLAILERARATPSEFSTVPAEAELQFLVENLPLYLWTTDRRLHITSQWGSKAHQCEDFPHHSIGRSIQEFVHGREASEPPVKQHYLALRGISSRIEYATANRLYDLSIEPYRGTHGQVIGCVAMALDITEQRKSEDEVRYSATHDGLTGLANYREFVDCLEREVRRADRTGQHFAVMLLDLDDLKFINDRMGHLTGNLALKRLASVMKDHCRATELAARFGGDEFAILLLNADAERARAVADRIRNCLRLQKEPPALSVSIGLSVYPEDGPGASELLEAADKRLYQDKKSRASRNSARVGQNK